MFIYELDSIKGKIAGGKYSCACKSVSRFARNSLECIESIRALKDCGTTVVFENDNIDTKTMNSEMVLYANLQARFHCKGAEVRRMVNELRCKGVPICSSNQYLDSF